eukprot:TRINITY_DN23281_c0_g3_i1.p1 TRINITY_DN23281_c0_g3~~TRINITY_DN23281_c0_g3_i1.p1  ORF type:complete len:702 (-),score=65.97 TRINITY_DN23281_c0_g3_i1:803-2908(-)
MFLASHGHRIRRLLQHFEGEIAETNFVKIHSTTVCTKTSWGLVALAATTGFSAIYPWHEGMQFENEAGALVAQYHLVSKIVVVVSSAIAASLYRCNVITEYCGPVAIERITTCLLCLGLLAIGSSRPYYFTWMCGYDPDVIYTTSDGKGMPPVERGNHALTCLLVDTALTCAHMAVPLRWYFFICVDLVGFLILVVSVIFWSAESPISVNVFLLVNMAVLIAFMLYGSWNIEHEKRKSWLSVLLEKRQRVEVEFKLEQQKARSGSRQNHDVDLNSHPSTSTWVFNLEKAQENAETLRQKLSSLAELGRQRHWLLDETAVKFKPGLIGSGSFGLVVHGTFNGMPVAIKVPKGDSDSRLAAMGNELAALRHLRHPNIMAFYGACVVPRLNQAALVLELVKGQPLDIFVIGRTELLPLVQQAHILIGVCRALRYLHSCSPPVVHGDIKGSNIIIENVADGGLWPKLIDFGLSRLLTKHAKPLGGTLRYMAPEVIEGLEPACSSDVFSFGRVIYTVAACRHPWSHLSHDEFASATHSSTLPVLEWPEELLSSTVKHIAEICTDREPKCRPSTDEVCDAHLANLIDAEALKDPVTCATPFQPMLPYEEQHLWSPAWPDAYPRIVKWNIPILNTRALEISGSMQVAPGAMEDRLERMQSSHWSSLLANAVSLDKKQQLGSPLSKRQEDASSQVDGSHATKALGRTAL